MAKKKVKIREVDLGMEKIIRNLRDLKGKGVKVGLQGASGTKKHKGSISQSVVEIGAIHEFGAGNIPERSFLRSTFNLKKNEWRKFNAKILDKFVLKRIAIAPLNTILGVMGSKLQRDIRNRIREGINPPNKPSTLRKKLRLTAKGEQRSPKPLIDTGQLINSIHWQKKVEE